MLNKTDKQPEALRLANRLENGGEPDLPLLRAFAAAELRSQHALIVELVGRLSSYVSLDETGGIKDSLHILAKEALAKAKEYQS